MTITKIFFHLNYVPRSP